LDPAENIFGISKKKKKILQKREIFESEKKSFILSFLGGNS
jgi:hypothetical protein